MLQDVGLTYQQFKNCRDNLSFWLEHLPRAQVRPGEGPSQIAYKLQAQKVRSWGCLGGDLGGTWPPSGQCSKRPQSSDHRPSG